MTTAHNRATAEMLSMYPHSHCTPAERALYHVDHAAHYLNLAGQVLTYFVLSFERANEWARGETMGTCEIHLESAEWHLNQITRSLPERNTSLPRTLERPATHLDEVWFAAKIAFLAGDHTNPWPRGSEQAAVWDLSVKAEAQAEAAWEHSPEVVAHESVVESEAVEVRRLRSSDEITPDRMAELIRNKIKRLLDYLAWDFAPTVVVNGERQGLVSLTRRLASVPTPYEREYGILPELEAPADDGAA